MSGSNLGTPRADLKTVHSSVAKELGKRQPEIHMVQKGRQYIKKRIHHASSNLEKVLEKACAFYFWSIPSVNKLEYYVCYVLWLLLLLRRKKCWIRTKDRARSDLKTIGSKVDNELERRRQAQVRPPSPISYTFLMLALGLVGHNIHCFPDLRFNGSWLVVPWKGRKTKSTAGKYALPSKTPKITNPCAPPYRPWP